MTRVSSGVQVRWARPFRWGQASSWVTESPRLRLAFEACVENRPLTCMNVNNATINVRPLHCEIFNPNSSEGTTIVFSRRYARQCAVCTRYYGTGATVDCRVDTAGAVRWSVVSSSATALMCDDVAADDLKNNDERGPGRNSLASRRGTSLINIRLCMPAPARIDRMVATILNRAFESGYPHDRVDDRRI